MKKINLIIITSFLLTACSGFKDAGKVLRNEKVRTTDEFLVKKRNPLILPPDYNEIPAPGSTQKKEINSGDKFKKIIRAENKQNKANSTTSSTEKSILNRIGK